jgi:predicted transcriptional regulator
LVGKAWRYTPAHTREKHIAQLMLDALELAGSRDDALVHFVRSVSADEAEVLREALVRLDRRGRRRGGRGRRTGEPER